MIIDSENPHMQIDKRLERAGIIHQKKMIKYRVMNAVDNISKLTAIRNNPDYEYFYNRLKVFHEEQVKSQLKEDLFDPHFWQYNSFDNGEPPEDDEDRVIEDVIMRVFQQVYYAIQYPKLFELNYGAMSKDIKQDRLDLLKQSIRERFFTQLNLDERLHREFNKLLYQVDLFSLVCVVSLEKFFIDWWEFYETLIFIDHTTDFIKYELLIKHDLITKLEKHLMFLPREIRAQHLITKTTNVQIRPENYQAFRGAESQTCLYTIFELPLDYSGSIEENINNYLSTLSSIYQSATNTPTSNSLELQKKANDISKLQEEFQSKYYAKISAIKDVSLCPRVILALYQTYCTLNNNEDMVSFFNYMYDLLTKGKIKFEHNLGSDAVKKNKANLRILIKPIQHILYTTSRQSKKDQPPSPKQTNNKMGGDKNNTPHDKIIENLYEISASKLSKLLKS